MKKNILSLTLLLFITLFAKAQDLPIDPNTGKVTFMSVVDANGLSSAELYKAMKEWALKQGFKMKVEKESEGEMELEGVIPVEYARIKGRNEQSQVPVTLHLMAKDNKYRYIFIDFKHIGSDKTLSGGKLENVTPECGLSGINASNWNIIKKKVNADVEGKITELKKQILAVQNDPSKKKDW